MKNIEKNLLKIVISYNFENLCSFRNDLLFFDDRKSHKTSTLLKESLFYFIHKPGHMVRMTSMPIYS